jgi:hypothetical protein
MTIREADSSFAGIRVGSPEQFVWLGWIVRAVLVLNLLDAVFTLLWVRAGLATEANTLMEELVNEHAVGFIAVKLGLVGLGSMLLWRRRRRPSAVIGIFTVFIAYYLVLLYHLNYASGIVRQLLSAS